ncbi:MAG: DUF4870 domain-containing protein [candidate division WOR-3 bacterium]
MKCPKCNQDISDSATTCAYCGAAVRQVAAPLSPSGPQDEIEKAKGIVWLSYVWLLFLVPLLSMKDNNFAKFHAKQGLVMFGYEVVISIVASIIPFLGWFIIGPICGLVMLVLSIIGIVKSLQGEYWKAPLGINKIAESLKF